MKPTAFCASRSVTDFAVERSISEFSMICTGPTTLAPARPPPAGADVTAGESAATRSRPMTWTVPVTRLRGSGRPPGVTTTSPRETCADAGASQPALDKSTALIATDRTVDLFTPPPSVMCPHENCDFSRNVEPVAAHIGPRLAGEMRAQVRAAAVRPSQPVGEIVREFRYIGDDPRERPFPDHNRMRLRRWRKRAQRHIDTWSFILAVPRRGQASGKTHAARAVLRRYDPNHGAACPGETTQEECIGLFQRRSDVGSENRVMSAGRNVGRIPAAGDGAGRIIEAREPRSHARRRLDRGPSMTGRAQRISELPAAGANIEQIAGLPNALADERCNARDVVGAVDPRGVELDRVDDVGHAGEVRLRLRHNTGRGPI